MSNVMLNFISECLVVLSDFLLEEPIIYFVGLFLSLLIVELIRKITKIGG